MGVRIGLGLFTGQIPPGSDRTFAQEYRDIIELSLLAETLGFDSVWVSEHHGAGDGYLPSLLPMLGALAAATERVQLGTGVVLTPFHHPLRLAEDAAVVDQISEGRLILGLGLGWREEEFRMFDIPIRERVRRTSETVEILRKAWTGERFSHEGRVFSLDRSGSPLHRPEPEGRPSTWAGLSRRRFAGPVPSATATSEAGAASRMGGRRCSGPRRVPDGRGRTPRRSASLISRTFV